MDTNTDFHIYFMWKSIQISICLVTTLLKVSVAVNAVTTVVSSVCVCIFKQKWGNLIIFCLVLYKSFCICVSSSSWDGSPGCRNTERFCEQPKTWNKIPSSLNTGEKSCSNNSLRSMGTSSKSKNIAVLSKNLSCYLLHFTCVDCKSLCIGIWFFQTLPLRVVLLEV